VTARWRLVLDGPTDAAENMARDRAIQLAVETGDSLPTLRLYRWERPTVTLGRHQRVEGVDLGLCEQLGIDVVRRFTGGRGVLHDDEITYSVVARVADGVPRGVAASYRYLCEPLAYAFRALGVDAAVTERDRGVGTSSSCYLATSRADLSVGALKLSGSAQVWYGGTVLQHGSFTLSRDVSREARVFRLDDEHARLLEEGAATIETVSGTRPSLDGIRLAIITEFERVLDLSFAPGALSDGELGTTARLRPEVMLRPTPSLGDT
jgi:lipoate-protein ligase A